MRKKRGKWKFFPAREGGSPIPTFSNHETTQKVNIFIKTKNVPKVLKCKMNHKLFFFTNMGFPNWGEGGVPDLGTFPTFSCFFCVANVPKPATILLQFCEIYFVDFDGYACDVTWPHLVSPLAGSAACWASSLHASTCTYATRSSNILIHLQDDICV